MSGGSALTQEARAEQMRYGLEVANSALVTYGELVAALCAPASQHSPAVRSFHPHPEPVSLGAMAIVRLKRTFWHCESCFLLCVVGAAANLTAR
jgi:hypothetical protein